MAMEILKTVPIKEKTYNICTLNPDDGSWILKQLMKVFSKFINSQETEQAAPSTEEPENFAEMLIKQMILELDRDNFLKIRKIALSSVTFNENIGETTAQLPIVLASGIYALPELNDIGILDYLSDEVIINNMKPFFTKDGLKAYLTGQLISSR